MEKAWQKGSLCLQKTQAASSQTLVSNHELQLSQAETIPLHTNVPPQKVREVRLLILSRKGKKIICVLILIETNGFAAIHMSAVHGKAEGQDSSKEEPKDTFAIFL